MDPGRLGRGAGPWAWVTDQKHRGARRELELHRLWERYAENPKAHAGAPALKSRLGAVAQELGQAKVPFEDWQVLYRQALALGRALAAEPQLLAQYAAKELPAMDPTLDPPTGLEHERTVERAFRAW